MGLDGLEAAFPTFPLCVNSHDNDEDDKELIFHNSERLTSK